MNFPSACNIELWPLLVFCNTFLICLFSIEWGHSQQCSGVTPSSGVMQQCLENQAMLVMESRPPNDKAWTLVLWAISRTQNKMLNVSSFQWHHTPRYSCGLELSWDPSLGKNICGFQSTGYNFLISVSSQISLKTVASKAKEFLRHYWQEGVTCFSSLEEENYSNNYIFNIS